MAAMDCARDPAFLVWVTWIKSEPPVPLTAHPSPGEITWAWQDELGHLYSSPRKLEVGIREAE
jgi:hypothetical protein